MTFRQLIAQAKKTGKVSTPKGVAIRIRSAEGYAPKSPAFPRQRLSEEENHG